MRPVLYLVPLMPTILTLFLVVILSSCYSLASSGGHLDDNDGDLPEISDLGDKSPEHGLFAFGFTVAALMILFIARHRFSHLRLVIARSEQACGGATAATCRTLNALWAAVAVAACCFMLLMAFVCESCSDLHYVGAIGAFGLVAVFQTLHTALVALLLARGVTVAGATRPGGAAEGDKWYSTATVLVSSGLLAGGFFSTLAWVSTKSAVPEYVAAASPFAYMIVAFSPDLYAYAFHVLDAGDGDAGAGLLAGDEA